MKVFFRYYKAEFYKRRRSVFYPIHIIFPILLTLGLTLLLYFRRESINELYIGFNFFQIISLTLPLVVSTVCGFVANQEEENRYQIILGASNRPISFLAQISMLVTMSIFSVLLSLGLMSFCMEVFLGVELGYIGLFLKSCMLIVLGTILLYIVQLFIGYVFGIGICCLGGFLGVIVAALGVTGLGDGVWYFLPQSWSVRLTSMTFFKGLESEFQLAMPIIIGLTLISLFLSLMWISKWQGRKSSE